METNKDILEEISSSASAFDINASLTEEEEKLLGHVTNSQKQEPVDRVPVLKDLDESPDGPADAVLEYENNYSYNAQYMRYLKCQALAALLAFDEGWRGFEELVLKPYLSERRREDVEYRGDDPNKSFSLRLRRQEAEDLVRFIRVTTRELAAMPKPIPPKEL